MYGNLIKVAFRNFFKEKFYTIINVTGLAVGISVAMLISIYILNELSYDRFHTKSNRIYRVISHLQMGSNIFNMISTFPQLASALRNEVPEVEFAVRLSGPSTNLARVEEVSFHEENIYFAGPDFFQVFDFNLLSGDPKTVLNQRNELVLTPAFASKYFKTTDWQNIVGQSIQLDEEVYKITGIVEEAPANSHFHYAAIGSIESIPNGRDETWGSMNLSTYLMIKEGTEIETVVKKIPDVIEVHNPGFKDRSKQGITLDFNAQPLTDIHLYSNLQGEFEPNGDITTVFIFGIVALVVLVLASVNFINLTTARSANRAKEVGVRKVLGSGTGQLVRQFTLESIIMVAIGTLIALGLIELARTPFALLTGRALSFNLLFQPIGLIALVAFVILLGTLAGSYPSFFMARLKPSLVLKGDVRSGFKSSRLRNSLVTLQFVISIVLITSTLIVQQQLEFMRSKKLGFDKENVLVIGNADRLDSQKAFMNDLSHLSGVKQTSASEYKPFAGYNGTVSVTDADRENRKLINTAHVDYDYIDVMKHEVLVGRGFSRDFKSDSAGVVLNEVAANYLYEGDPLGKKLYLADDDQSKGLTVIGVIKNFNYQSLKTEVTPLVFLLKENEPNLYVRLNPGDFEETIAQINSLWEDHADIAFDYSFFDDSYNDLFKEEAKLGTLFSVFTGFALFIACLGLLGLAAYMSEQRSKELSIRKVLGASLSQIVVLLSKDFTRLILIATLLAFPLAYYMMEQWLATYAYRVSMSASLFIISGALVLLVALSTVSYQSIKAALVNPVESLKKE